MLIIKVKESESIERALKRYKRKFDRTGVQKEKRKRMFYAKPSMVKKEEIKKAVNRQKYFAEENY